MPESSPVLNFTILLMAALVGGMVAHRLKQPVVVGYLVVGVVVGPHSLGLIGDVAFTESMATIGVALLMLTLGMEFSFRQLRQMGKIGILGGVAQITLTSIAGAAVSALVFQWPLPEAILFGLVIYNSSTAVCLKVLMDRGELDSMHGRIMVAMLILQDVAVVVMMVGTPLLGEPITNMLIAVAWALVKSIYFVGLSVILGLLVLPWLLGRVGGLRHRELFLLTVLVLCLGAAVTTYFVGLPIIFGAFVIGLMLRESRFSQEALAEITPLRDIFAALFFISLGMLLDPRFVLANWGLVLITVAIVMIIKTGVVYGVVRMFGFGGRVAVLAGAGLLQVGEFGFILAQSGVNAGIVSADFYSFIVASATITMLLTPLSIAVTNRVYSRLASAPPPPSRESEGSPPATLAGDSARVVAAGWGRVGRNVVEAIRASGIPLTVVEINPEMVFKLRRDGIDCIYGDASNSHILQQANIRGATILIVTFPDPLAATSTIKNALRFNPNLKVIARSHARVEVAAMENIGDIELVSPEYEASIAFIVKALSAAGQKAEQINETLDSLRARGKLTDSVPSLAPGAAGKNTINT